MIEATVTGIEQTIARFDAMPERLRNDIREAMTRQWFGLQAAVVTDKLSGDPLHRRTGVLASSINVGGSDTASEFVEDEASFIGRVGTKVKYARPHEFGGTFQVPEHARQISMVFGRPVAPHQIMVRSHTVTFPERSFLRSTMREREAQIREALAKAVHDAAAKV